MNRVKKQHNAKLFALSQLISILGSALSIFAISIYIFEETHSVFIFSILLLSRSLPSAITNIFTGTLSDKYNPKILIIIGDTGAAISTMMLVLILLSNRHSIIFILLAAVINSIFSGIQSPATMVFISRLVSVNQLGNLNGMLSLIRNSSIILAPMIAAAILSFTSIYVIFIIDMMSFIISSLIIMNIKLNKDTSPGTNSKKITINVVKNIQQMFKYTLNDPLLNILFALQIFISISVAISTVIYTPLILISASEKELGILSSIYAAGGIIGSLIMTKVGVKSEKISKLFIIYTLIGLGYFYLGLINHFWGWFIGSIVLGFSLSVAATFVNTFTMMRTTNENRGNYFGFIMSVNAFLNPLTILITGFFANNFANEIYGDKNGLNIIYLVLSALVLLSVPILLYYISTSKAHYKSLL